MARQHPHPTAARGARDPRALHAACSTCRAHAADEAGLCPLCRSAQAGDLVTDLRAQRGSHARAAQDHGVVA